MRRRFLAVAFALGSFVLAGAAVAAGPEDAAQAAAESWLGTVDGGDYAGSWEQAAKAFKGAVGQGQWVQAVAGVRKPLGNVVSRTLKSREHTRKPPTTRVIGGNVYTAGGSGEYVVIQYETAFANKAAASETVIATADADGAWRVSGYVVR